VEVKRGWRFLCADQACNVTAHQEDADRGLQFFYGGRQGSSASLAVQVATLGIIIVTNEKDRNRAPQAATGCRDETRASRGARGFCAINSTPCLCFWTCVADFGAPKELDMSGAKVRIEGTVDTTRQLPPRPPSF
jgi:hypothetical protein